MKVHDLPRNSVVAVMSCGNAEAFLHINKDGLINPFWVSEYGKNGFSVHGELDKHFGGAGEHEHWRDYSGKLEVVQSHVTSADKVNFKRCMKFFKKRSTKR